MVRNRCFSYHHKHNKTKSDEEKEKDILCACFVQNHLLLLSSSLVLLLPLLVCLMNYTSACKLLEQIKMLLRVIHLCYFLSLLL